MSESSFFREQEIGLSSGTKKESTNPYFSSNMPHSEATGGFPGMENSVSGSSNNTLATANMNKHDSSTLNYFESTGIFQGGTSLGEKQSSDSIKILHTSKRGIQNSDLTTRHESETVVTSVVNPSTFFLNETK